jgi:hypothetical protein
MYPKHTEPMITHVVNHQKHKKCKTLTGIVRTFYENHVLTEKTIVSEHFAFDSPLTSGQVSFKGSN